MSNSKLELVEDFYEFTMANGYFQNNMQDKIAYFDLFFRKIPDKGGYAIVAGLEQIIDFIKDFHFDDEDINYLRTLNKFNDNFLNYLKNLKFTGDIWAIPEGTPVFPYEPLITVKAPIIQAQILETLLLLTINHQSLIATKSSRIVREAAGRSILEFGSRRAHGVDAAVFGARAAVIGGCNTTACTFAAQKFNLPPSGTMAHSWIESFENEYDAFKAYADLYPNDCVILVDTYNTLESGVPNAIKLAKEVLEPKGSKLKAIRLDSGDLAYLSKEARKMLDEAGLNYCKIIGTNALDEWLIRDLILQDAKIDIFGVGENLITAKSDAVFGGVYKLCALETGGKLIPKIKISENVAKITNPSFKKIYRFFDKKTGKALADVLTLHDEEIPEDNYLIFDPQNPWKKKVLKNYIAKPLLEKIFENGNLVYNNPTLSQIVKYSKEQISNFWDEVLRIENPHKYYVDLSPNLWELKNKMLLEKK